MNISKLFLDAAEKYPEQIAIIEKSKEISYKNLAKETKETATYFRKMGINEGDRVLVFVPMSIDLYRIVLALFYCGATAVFLDEWVSKKRMEVCCDIADCKGFIGIFKARLFALFSKELRKIPIKLSTHRTVSELTQISDVNAASVALITFTTGSTGQPKAAKRTHGFLKEQFDALFDEIQPKNNDIDMPVLPIVLFMNLGVGCTSVISDFKMSKPEKMDVGLVVNQINKHHVNRITSSPFFIGQLSDYALGNSITYTGIEKVFTGGAPVFPAPAKLYKSAFPAAEINIVYGSTEVEPISSIRAKDLISDGDIAKNGLAVGKPYRKSTVRIIKINDQPIHHQTPHSFEELLLSEGEIGEIIVSGPHVLKEYFNGEEAFRANKIIVDGTVWHRTGDSGKLMNGELFLYGRCAQIINAKNSLIAPFIIENQLQEIEGIEMGTLIKVNDKLVLAVETLLPAEKVKALTSEIPSDLIKIIDKIPRDPRHNSKIDYGQLKELITQKL